MRELRHPLRPLGAPAVERVVDEIGGEVEQGRADQALERAEAAAEHPVDRPDHRHRASRAPIRRASSLPAMKTTPKTSAKASTAAPATVPTMPGQRRPTGPCRLFSATIAAIQASSDKQLGDETAQEAEHDAAADEQQRR